MNISATKRVNMQRAIAPLAMVFAGCALLGIGQPLQAGERSADITVSVRVMARTLIDAESSPRQLQVSAADVARGYVEVLGATQLVVTSTNRRGYLLSVWPQVQLFSTVVVSNGETRAELGADGGEIFERRWGQMLNLPLDFRFTLAPGVKPGIYPWPVRFQVSPLTF